MILTRSGLVLGGLFLVLAGFVAAGPQAGLLIAIGLGFGLVLEGLRLGFSGPWRQIWFERDGRGFLAQVLAVGITAAVALPLLAAAPEELSGAHAPVGLAMIVAAFVFGIAMQIVFGCGSGTLVNAGSGNAIGALALVGFIAGSFFGTLHLGWWTSLGSLPVLTLQGMFGDNGGLVLTLAGLAALAGLIWWRAEPGKRMPPARLWIAAGLVAALALANLVIAGQPWGIVYGLGLWGAKIAQAGGADVAANAFWANPAHAERLTASVLTDITTLTNIGLLFGAFMAMRWRRSPDAQVVRLKPQGWVCVLMAGLVLGYSARVAFGCNVGAFFSGVSTGSLHGWVWLAAAFAGSIIGVRLRPVLLPAAEPRGREVAA